MEELDTLAHSNALYIAQAGKFFELLTKLYRTKPENTAVAEIANYIAKESDRAITLEMLCKEFHFSKNIIHMFKKAMGMTPITYMNDLRLRKAEYLMEVTSDPLESVAAQCGFQNYSHFYKLFCRKFGLSPAQWRKQRRIG